MPRLSRVARYSALTFNVVVCEHTVETWQAGHSTSAVSLLHRGHEKTGSVWTPQSQRFLCVSVPQAGQRRLPVSMVMVPPSMFGLGV